MSRQETLQSACDKLNLNLNVNVNALSAVDYQDLDHMLVSHQYKLLYCYVPKVRTLFHKLKISRQYLIVVRWRARIGNEYLWR